MLLPPPLSKSMRKESRIISENQTAQFTREGFDGKTYIDKQEAAGFTVLKIAVHGKHPRKQMLGDTTRTYFVIKGTGSFIVDEREQSVGEGDCIVVYGGSTYEYAGVMTLLELNVSPSNSFGDRKL